MKNLRLLFNIFLLGGVCMLLTACQKSDEQDSVLYPPVPDSITPSENTGGGNTIDISKIVSENVSASVEYKYYTFVVDVYTYLADTEYFKGRSDIVYGIEWTYSNRSGQSYVYRIDPKNNFMMTTKVSSSHYNVIVPVFMWEDDEDNTSKMNFYSFQYYGLKIKEEQGDVLDRTEQDYIKTLEKKLGSYISEVNAYRGKVFVEIGGEKYYVSSFKR